MYHDGLSLPMSKSRSVLFNATLLGLK